jgi:hypothetical protein
VLKVNLSDGRTLHYNLNDQADALAWSARSQDHAFQQKITALTILCDGVVYSLPRPVWGDATLTADLVHADAVRRIKGGQMLACRTRSVEVAIMVHSSQRAARVDISQHGDVPVVREV